MGKKRRFGSDEQYKGSTMMSNFYKDKARNFADEYKQVDDTVNELANDTELQDFFKQVEEEDAAREAEEAAAIEQLNAEAKAEAEAPKDIVEKEAQATLAPEKYSGLKEITNRIKELEDLNVVRAEERKYKEAHKDTKFGDTPLDYIHESIVGGTYGLAEMLTPNAPFMSDKQQKELETLKIKKQSILNPIYDTLLKRNDNLVKSINEQAKLTGGMFDVDETSRDLQTANNLAWQERDKITAAKAEGGNAFADFHNNFFGNTGSKIKNLFSVGIIPTIDNHKYLSAMQKQNAGEPLTDSEQLILTAGAHKEDTSKAIKPMGFAGELGQGLETSLELGGSMMLGGAFTAAPKVAAIEALLNKGVSTAATKAIVGFGELVAQTGMSPFTYNTYAQKMTSPVVVTKDSKGKEVILTSKTGKQTYEGQAKNALAKSNEHLNRLVKEGKGDSEEANAVRDEIVQINDSMSKIYDPETHEIAEDIEPINAALHAVGESSKEIFSELFVGKAAGRLAQGAKKMLAGTPAEAFTKGVGKVFNKLTPSMGTTPVGRITSNLGYHTNFNEVFQSVPEEFVEELFSGIVPTYSAEKGGYNMEDYYKQLKQFQDPNFYAQIAASTLLMGGVPAMYGAAKHQAQYRTNEDYKKAYDAKKQEMEDLGDFYNKLNRHATDKDVADAITMRTGNTLYSIPQYEGKVAELRNNGKEVEAKMMEGMAFQNLAAQASRTNSLDDFELAMKRMTRNGGLHSDTVANAQEAMANTIPVLRDLEYRYKDRPNYNKIADLTVNNQVHNLDNKHYREAIASTRKVIDDKITKLKEQGHIDESFDIDSIISPVVTTEGVFDSQHQEPVRMPEVVNTIIGEDLNRLTELQAGLDTTNQHMLKNSEELAYQTNQKNLPAIKAEMKKEQIMQALQEAMTTQNPEVVQRNLVATLELQPNEELVGDEIVVDENGKKGLKVINNDTQEIRIVELTPEGEKLHAKQDELQLATEAAEVPVVEEVQEEFQEGPPPAPEGYNIVGEPEQTQPEIQGEVEVALEEHNQDDEAINAILATAGIVVTNTPSDVPNVLFSRYGDNKDKIKETVDRIVNEIAEKKGKDVSDVTFEDFVDNFVRKFGKDFTQNLFDGYKTIWEATGRDAGDAEALYDKLYNDLDFLNEMALEALAIRPSQGDVENKVKEIEVEVQTSTAKKTNYDPNGKPAIVDVDPNSEDRRTNLPDLKFAFNFQKVKRMPDGSFVVVSDTLKTEGVVDNNFILDHELLRELQEKGTPLNVVELNDDSVTILSRDAQGNKETMTWGDYKSKKNVQPGSKLWASMVPMVITHTVGDRTVPLAMVHSPNWYNDENISDKLTAEEKQKVIEKGYNESLALRQSVISNKAKGVFTTIQIGSAHFGQIDNIKQHSDKVPRSLTQAAGDTTLAIVKNVKGQVEFHTEKGIKFKLKLATDPNTKLESGAPMFEEGATIDIRPAYIDEAGDQVYMPILTMNNSPIAPQGNLRQGLSTQVESTVKAATLASVIINNQGNPEVLKRIEQSYGMTLSKAMEIVEAIKRESGIDLKEGSGTRTGLASFVGLFTKTNHGDYPLTNDIVKKAPGFTYFSDKFADKQGKVSSNATALQVYHMRQGSSIPNSFSIGRSIGNSSVDVLLNNIDTMFNKDTGIFRETQFNNSMEHLGSRTRVPMFNEGGDLIETKPYNDVVKDNLRTNIISHEIETVHGEKKWVLDVQPMIYIQATGAGKEMPNPTNVARPEIQPAAVATTVLVEQLATPVPTELGQREEDVPEPSHTPVSFRETIQELNNNLNESEREYLSSLLNNLDTDEVHASRWKFTPEQEAIIANLKSNSIVGLTAEENKELVGSLKNMIINSLDFDKPITLKNIKDAIENSVQTHLAPVQGKNTAILKALEAMSESALSVADTKGRSLAKLQEKLIKDQATLENILSQSEKLVSTKKGSLGSVASEFNNLFNTNFEEEDFDTDESSDESYSKSFLEKELKLSYSVGLKLSLFGLPVTETNGVVRTTFLNTPKSHPADDIYSILVDVMSTIPSDWNALMSILEDRHKNRKKEVFLQVKEKLDALPENYKNEFLHKTISKKLTVQKVMVSERFDAQTGESEGFSIRVIDENSSKEDIRWTNKIKGDFVSSPFSRVNDNFDSVLNLDYAKKIHTELNALTAKKTLTFEETRDIFNKIGLKMIADNTVEKVMELNGVLGSKGILRYVHGQLTALINASEENPDGVILSNPNNNLFATAGSALKVIVDNEVMLNGNYVARAIRVNGKTMQGTIPNTAIYDTVQELKNTTKSSLFNAMKESSLTINNYLLKMLETDEDFNESFGVDFSSPDAIKYHGNDSFGDTDFDKIAEQDNIVATLGVYTNKFGNKTLKTHSPVKGLNFRIGQMTTGTLADKGRMLYFKTALLNLNKEVMNFDASGTIQIEGVLGDFLATQLFNSEMDRILDTYANERNHQGSGIKEYDTAAKLFLALPSLNSITIKDKTGKDRNIHEYLSNPAFNKDNIDSVLDAFREQAKIKIQEYINSEIDTKLTADGYQGDFLKFGIYNPKAEEHQPRIVGLDAEYMNSKEVSIEDDPALDHAANWRRHEAAKMRYLMAEFAINNILNLNNVHQLFLGDIAYYSKAGKIKSLAFTDGKIDPKKISDPNIYAQILEGIGVIIDKRAASLIAPGLKLANSDSPVFSKATHHMHIAVNDVESMSSVMKELVQAQFGLSEVENAAYDGVIEANENISRLEEELANKPEEARAKEIKAQIAQNKNIRKAYIEGPLVGLKDYFNIIGTDAQEYSTWAAHIDMLYRQGKLSNEEKSLLDSAYTKLSAGEEVSAAEVKVLMQPVKPVYTGLVEDGTLLRPVYIKSSSFPLLPQLTKNLKLDKVRQALEHIERTEGIPTRLTYQTANKIGAKDTKLTMEDMYSKPLEELYGKKDGVVSGVMSDAASMLPTKNFKIQQETPSKEYKAFKEGKDPKITMGSQFFKIILGNGINKITRAVFPNLFGNEFLKSLGIQDATHITGEQLDEVYFKAYSEYSDTILKSLNNELGLHASKDFYSLNAAGQNRIITNLEQIIKKEVNERGYPTYLKDASALTEDEGLLKTEMPLMFDTNAHKFESLLQSIISSRLITHKLPGNSHISASSEGFERVASLEEVKNRHGVIWLDGRKEGELKSSYITDENGKQVLVESEVAIKSHWKTTDKDGKTTYVDLSSDEYSKPILDADGKVVGRELLTDKIDPELLSHFSFRIPTSSHQSGVVLKVAAFLPSECGDLLIVPKEHTVQLGEDYDIDKRYIYKSNYFVDSKTGQVKKVRYEDLQASINAINEVLKGESPTLEQIQAAVPLSVLGELGYSLVDGGIDPNVEGQDTPVLTVGARVIDKMKIKMLENVLIDVYKSVYQSPDAEVQQKIFKPLITDVAEEAANFMDKKLNSGKEKKNFSIFSDNYQRYLLKLGANGKGGIGVHSNAVTLQAQFQRLPNKQKIRVVDVKTNKNGDTFSIPFEETIGDNNASDGWIGKNDKAMYGGRDVADQHAENQNVSTDNINKQIMVKRNENSHTMGVYAFMAYLGFDKTSFIGAEDSNGELLTFATKEDRAKTGFTDEKKYVNDIHLPSLFMNQPILRDFVEMKEASQSMTADYSANIDEQILVQLSQKYGFAVGQQKDGTIRTTSFIVGDTYQDMSKQMTGNRLWENLTVEGADANMQAAVLQKFFRLSQKATELSKYQSAINLSTSKLGVSYFEVLQRIATLDEMAGDTSFQGVHNLVGDYKPAVYYNNTSGVIPDSTMKQMEADGYTLIGENFWKPTTIEGKMLINSLKAAENLMPIYFPYQNKHINGMLRKIFSIKGADFTKKSATTLKLKYGIMSSLSDFISANVGFTQGNITLDRKRIFNDTVTNRSLASIIQHLKERKHPIMANTLLADLEPRLNINASGVSTINHIADTSTTFDKNSKYEAFNELLQSEEVLGEFNGEQYTTSMLAQDLAAYAFFSDNENGATGFKQFISVDYMKMVGVTKNYRDALKDIMNGNSETLLQNFVTQYVQHNPEVTTKLTAKNAKDLQFEPIVGQLNAVWTLEEFKLSGTDIGDFIAVKDLSIKTSTKPYRLFKYNSETDTYQKIDVLGTRGFNEYSPNEVAPNSVLDGPQYSGTKEVRFVQVNGKTHLKEGPNERNIHTPDIIPIANGVEGVLKQIYDSPHTAQHNPEYKAIIEELQDYVKTGVTIKYGPTIGGAFGQYNKDTNTITIVPDLIQKALVKTQGDLNKAMSLVKEVIIEEVLHSMTVNEFNKYVKSINADQEVTLIDDAPEFAKKIVSLYATARQAVPYDAQDASTYYSQNIYEFMAGVFVSSDYRANLDANSKGFVDKFKQMLKSLFNFKHKGEPLTYKSEIYNSIKELLKTEKEVAPEDKGVKIATGPSTFQAVLANDTVIVPEAPKRVIPEVKEEIQEKEVPLQESDLSKQYNNLRGEVAELEGIVEAISRDLDMYEETDPYTIIARNLPRISTESAQKEAGIKAGVGKDIHSSLVSKTGIPVEKAAEQLKAEALADQGMTESQIRDAIIDILNAGSVRNYLESSGPRADLNDSKTRLKEAKKELKDFVATNKKEVKAFEQKEKIDRIIAEKKAAMAKEETTEEEEDCDVPF